MNTVILAKDLTKIYENGTLRNTVLKGISLAVNEGEFVTITGRSGAGKSTLLYQLSLLDDPTTGEVMIDGVRVGDLSANERTSFRLERLGYVFQDYALVPELTALENTAVPLLMQGVPMSEAYTRATKSLNEVGLGARLENLPSQLSGGEQQRVSIARAIAHGPKILFADEPTANLDSETARMVLDIFRTLHKGGQTIVMVTHEKESVVFADRVIVLHDGHVITDQ